MKRSEVFTPTALPKVTFIEDHLIEKRKTLLQALEMGGAVITLSGPSKSGKTVFVEKTLGGDNLIQVTGAGITQADTLWKRVFDIIGTPIPTSATSGSGAQQTIGGRVEGGIPLVGKGEVSTGANWSQTSAQVSDVSPDYLNLIIKELANSGLVVFIDDFHYIPLTVQNEIANLIKEAVRNGVRFICASVPYHSDDVIIANADLRGRMVKMDFDYWKPEELAKIAAKGFEALNVSVADAVVSAFAAEAAGSPQLMQALCLHLCFEKDVFERNEIRIGIPADLMLIGKVCKMTSLMNDYSSVIASMKEGPKTRGEKRKNYALNNTTVKDVYPLVLLAVAQDPPELTIRYQNLIGRIQSLCTADTPSGSSVTGACAQMSEIANGAANAFIIEWDSESDVLDLRDPYLLFALRWSDLL
jgi:hypothetical protein